MKQTSTKSEVGSKNVIYKESYWNVVKITGNVALLRRYDRYNNIIATEWVQIGVYHDATLKPTR